MSTNTSTPKLKAVNDFVIKFANVNGSGSASANSMFAKAIFRMGIPVSPRNLFPSNIQGAPTWYEVRVSEAGYLGRRGDFVDMIIAMNPQSFQQDVDNLLPGGYILYDNTKYINEQKIRDDINWLGIPLTEITVREYENPKQRFLFKNIIYVGALAALLDIDLSILKDNISSQFIGKEKLIAPNYHALDLGFNYAKQHFQCPLGIRLEARDLLGDSILIDGNTAAGIGCVYAGATVVGWYPITPSTSLIEAFEKYCNIHRVEDETGKASFAIIQAEDELSAIGITVGANWNGARAFTATSGPGISLMNEILGLAYYAEVPTVLFNIQRGGPSTGMPTRTQQSDITSCAYASHGDTKHVLLFPADPAECFEMAADSFDLAERLQTPIIIMSDLELGMNSWVSSPLIWDDKREYDRGKVLSEEDLNEMEHFGRYQDLDGDGITYRTIPGVHPEKGSFFTRGSSHNAMAAYSESSEEYVKNMNRLLLKFKTAADMVPGPAFGQTNANNDYGVIHFGTSSLVMEEAIDQLKSKGLTLDTMRLRAFPFAPSVYDFIAAHKKVFVVEQNINGQMRGLLISEGNLDSAKLTSVLHFDGMPITSVFVSETIADDLIPEALSKAINQLSSEHAKEIS
jgi:2-oxoglutarate ferredoxin oxidoreductase subunit alpha